VPGDAVASGAALVAALAAIKDASTTNRYLVQIEPGIFDVGKNGLAFPDFVDIAGSGEDATILRSGTEITCASAELREITIEDATIHCSDKHATLDHVTAKLSAALRNGVRITGGDALLRSVSIYGQGSSLGTTGLIFEHDASATTTDLHLDLDCVAANVLCVGITASLTSQISIRDSFIRVLVADTGIPAPSGLLVGAGLWVNNSDILVANTSINTTGKNEPSLRVDGEDAHTTAVQSSSLSNGVLCDAVTQNSASLDIGASLLAGGISMPTPPSGLTLYPCVIHCVADYDGQYQSLTCP